MKKEEIMKKYRSGELSPDDNIVLEQLIEEGVIDLEELEDLDNLHTRSALSAPEPGEKLRSGFYAMLSTEKQKINKPSIFSNILQFVTIPSWEPRNYRLAYTFVILAIGVLIGVLVNPLGLKQNELAELNGEIRQMKEMMMITMLDNSSATERLKAVSISIEIGVDTRVAAALLNTFNNDESVNVRLAALEALEPYAAEPNVREGLIKTIRNQISPMVLLSLAELMVRLEDKASIQEFNRYIEDLDISNEVKGQIKESLAEIT